MVFLWFSYDCLSKTSTFAIFDDTKMPSPVSACATRTWSRNELRHKVRQFPLVMKTFFLNHGKATILAHRIHGAGIYANIWGILMVNVTTYSIHGSYGLVALLFFFFFLHLFSTSLGRFLTSFSEYPLVMTNIANWKIHPFLRTVNHLFRSGPSIPWQTVSHNQRINLQFCWLRPWWSLLRPLKTSAGGERSSQAGHRESPGNPFDSWNR